MLLTLFKVNYVCMSYFCDYTDLGLCPDVAGTCIAGLDCPPFCENWDAGFRVFTMMVGAVDETQFQDIGEARVLFVIYMMLVVIVLLNVLIAIVTDSYSYIKDQRAGTVRMSYFFLDEVLLIFFMLLNFHYHNLIVLSRNCILVQPSRFCFSSGNYYYWHCCCSERMLQQ